MKHFILDKINLLLIFSSFLLTMTSLNAQKKLPFKKTDDSVVSIHRDKLIDTYEKAVKINLSEDNNNEEEFYKKNAVYLFQIGGGCFHPKHKEISVELNVDLVNITWKEPKKACPETGKYSPFFGKIIISKKDFPNYKKMKFKYYWK